MDFLKKNYQPQNNNRNIIKAVKGFLVALSLIVMVTSCSKKVEYSQEYMNQTSGRYLFNQENVIDVYYENNKLFLNWGELKVIEPVILDSETFFIADIYKKLHFVQHPETEKWYLSIFAEDNEDAISYDYLKVEDDYRTPSMHLKNGDYDKALTGYLQIKEQDSTSELLDEGNLNSLGYRLMRKKEYDNAVTVLKMNATLFPESANVYDSLADAYLAQGDSLQTYNNFIKTLEYNESNGKAQRFVDTYNKKQN